MVSFQRPNFRRDTGSPGRVSETLVAANIGQAFGVLPGPILTTERLILPRWRESDREPFSGMNTDPRVMEFFPALLSRQESETMVDRIEAHFDAHGFGLWAAELRQVKSFVGFIA